MESTDENASEWEEKHGNLNFLHMPGFEWLFFSFFFQFVRIQASVYIISKYQIIHSSMLSAIVLVTQLWNLSFHRSHRFSFKLFISTFQRKKKNEWTVFFLLSSHKGTAVLNANCIRIWLQCHSTFDFPLLFFHLISSDLALFPAFLCLAFI